MAESGHENRESRRWATVRWSGVAVLGVLALVYLLAVPLGIVAQDERLTTPEVILGGALLAGLAFADRLGEVRFGSVILTLRDVQVRQAKLETEVEAFRGRVTTLFLNTMAPSMYRNLLALLDEHRPYDEAHRADLIREMKLLRDLGYVGDFDEHQLAPTGDLSPHIQVTQRGREFVELRETLESAGVGHGG